MAEHVLVVDDDPDVARFVEVNLRSAGYSVTVASNGEEAMERALELRPDLVLLDVMMPKMDGFEVAQRLRRDSRTSSSSIIMLTAKALSSDKVLGLSSGADDYIIKPFDPVELLARVKGTLRRAREMRALSPLTGLPGNIRVQEEIRRRVAEDEPFSLLYADLDYFKAYNDHYGFVRGDRAIQGLARLINDVVHDMAGPQGFVGHVGGDDFIIIVPPDMGELVAKTLVERFDEVAPSLYDSIDRDRGCIEVPDRQGNVKVFPMMALSIGVASTSARRFTHYGEAVSTATELKQFAKREPGSSYALDRRAT
ncbi:MAG: response regulator [Actinomycetota bacterium]|nr:response regulator [Actinomycetota bacterium]